MKKSGALIVTGLAIFNLNSITLANDNQKEIDDLLSRYEKVQQEVSSINQKHQKALLEELKPLQDEFNEINSKLTELGYVPENLQGETNNAKYEITKMYFVDSSVNPGTKIAVLEMNITNKTTTPTSPYMLFITDYAPEQTDGTTTQVLNGGNGQLGNVENQELVEAGDTALNSGATIKAVIGFEPINPDLDIQFILNSSKISGDPKGFLFNPDYSVEE